MCFIFLHYVLRHTFTQTNTCRIGVQLRSERQAQNKYYGRHYCPNLTVTEGAKKFWQNLPSDTFYVRLYGKGRCKRWEEGGGRNVHVTRASQISFGCQIVSLFCPQACISDVNDCRKIRSIKRCNASVGIAVSKDTFC